jgi:hypothetical protein
MREFFKQELGYLEKKTGLRQYDRIMEKESWKEDLNDLLDILCRVCEQFSFIPDKDKQELIKQNIITDQEFTGFNAKIIYKWLSQAKHIYFKEQAHIDSKAPTGYKILEGEARQQKLKEWLASLGDGVKAVPQLTPAEWRREGKIDVQEIKAIKYPKNTEEQILEFELHRQWIKDNFHPVTGDKLPTWISEEEWLKNQK